MIKAGQSFSVHFLYLNVNFPWNIYPKYWKDKKIPIPKGNKTIAKNFLK